jgi:DNA-binding SARP family transcriptional activator
MSLKDLVAPSIETLTAHYMANKLLLIHPSSRHRTLLIAALIDSPPCPLYYYGMGVEDVDLVQFLVGLSHSLADQSPTFGRHINQARNQTPDDLEQLAEALANDLNELEDADYLLILDEYDRADGVPDIQVFVEHLLSYLPPQCHLLISSRTLPRLPWVALVAKHQAVVLRDARMLTSGFYSEYSAENPNVEVYALGPGYVMVNGQHVTTWEGHLPRLLFFFALDRPLVTRADICQAFWPELPLDQAVNVFHVTKRRLHKALGFDVLVHEGGHYRVNPALNLQYDVLDFVGSLVEGRGAQSAEEAVQHWQAAIDMYRGNYLQGHSDPWIVERRGDFREGYLEALTELARLRENEGQDEAALGLFLRAVSEAFNREDLHREVIRLYGKLGRRSEAAEHYQKLEADLNEKYGIEPSPETQAIYQEVIGG